MSRLYGTFFGKEFTCLFGIPLIVEETQGNQSKPQPNEMKCLNLKL